MGLFQKRNEKVQFLQLYSLVEIMVSGTYHYAYENYGFEYDSVSFFLV